MLRANFPTIARKTRRYAARSRPFTQEKGFHTVCLIFATHYRRPATLAGAVRFAILQPVGRKPDANPHRLAVRTSDLKSENTGSNPVGVRKILFFTPAIKTAKGLTIFLLLRRSQGTPEPRMLRSSEFQAPARQPILS